MENIPTKEAYKMIDDDMELQKYADDKNININYLKSVLGLENGKNCIKIPYYDEDNKLIAMRFRNSKRSKKSKFSWEKGSKATLYGLWTLKEAKSDYIILSEGESDTQSLWYNHMQALGAPRSLKLKEGICTYFRKI